MVIVEKLRFLGTFWYIKLAFLLQIDSKLLYYACSYYGATLGQAYVTGSTDVLNYNVVALSTRGLIEPLVRCAQVAPGS